MGLRLIALPVAEPVSVADQKLHMRVDGNDEDALIGAYITAARLMCEERISGVLVSQVWEWTLDSFRSCLSLPLGPVLSVDGITYVDQDGADQTVLPASYQADVRSRPARVVPVVGMCWPTPRAQLAAVTVRFTAGYGAPADVPPGIVAAVKLLAAHLYDNRTPVNAEGTAVELPYTVAALLMPHKQWGFS